MWTHTTRNSERIFLENAGTYSAMETTTKLNCEAIDLEYRLKIGGVKLHGNK